MKTPTPAQVEVRDHDSLALLLVAPAGCGKTEALAIRVAGLIESGRVQRPHRVLVTTFTNRAKDNLRDRLRDYMPYNTQRDFVTVSNFHGLATRLIRAHGPVAGIDPEMTMPDTDWITERSMELSLGWGGRDAVAEIMRETKQLALTDEQVAAALTKRGYRPAIDLEAERLAENRATYDDLLRYAELILANDTVAGLYRNHFAAVIVDEYQDLTPQQLRVLERVGDGNITFAGDLAQGIYRFAGARPTELDALIQPMCDDVIKFNESHRSSPAVLQMVNAMNPLTGGDDLVSADPSKWPAGGLSGTMTFAHARKEAAWVVKASRAILARAPGHRVAVMSRIKSRIRFVDEELDGIDGVEVHRWEDGILDTETAKIVRSTLARLNVAALDAQVDKLTYLRELADLDRIDELDTRRALVDALTWVLERLGDGLDVETISSRVRVGDQSTLINAPGVHLLSGHVGKGQQFEWVFIIGAEEGNMPFFRAQSPAELEEEARILGVMLSRARHGVVVTYSEVVPKADGVDKRRDLTQFSGHLKSGGPRDRADLIKWLKEAPWDELREL